MLLREFGNMRTQHSYAHEIVFSASQHNSIFSLKINPLFLLYEEIKSV
jgi:hypothetical protein